MKVQARYRCSCRYAGVYYICSISQVGCAGHATWMDGWMDGCTMDAPLTLDGSRARRRIGRSHCTSGGRERWRDGAEGGAEAMDDESEGA